LDPITPLKLDEFGPSYVADEWLNEDLREPEPEHVQKDLNQKLREGEQRMAPTVLAAETAVKDLLRHLKGESRGPKSAGFKQAQIDQFT
jgi:hypothetical protein